MAARGNRDEVVVATKVGSLPTRKGLCGEHRRGVRRIAAPSPHGPHRPVLRAPGRPRHPAGGDARRVRRAGAGGQGARDRGVQLLRRAAAQRGGDLPARRAAVLSRCSPTTTSSSGPSSRRSSCRCCRPRGCRACPTTGWQRFLTGKYRDAEVDSARAEGARAYLDDRGRAVLAVLDEIAAGHGVPVAAVALAWLAAQPTVVAPIASARTTEQLADLLPVLTLSLTDDEVRLLAHVSARRPPRASRYESTRESLRSSARVATNWRASRRVRTVTSGPAVRRAGPSPAPARRRDYQPMIPRVTPWSLVQRWCHVVANYLTDHDHRHRHRGVRRQVQRRRRRAARDEVRAQRRHHRAVVRAQSAAAAPAARGRPRCTASASARSREFAATPPPSSRVSIPRSRAARTALAVSTSTTASWKLAATSATGTGCPARCRASMCRATRSSAPRTRSRTARRGVRSVRGERRSRPRRPRARRGRCAARPGTAGRAAARPCRTPTGRVVDRGAERGDGAGHIRDVEQARVPARDQQRQARRQRAVLRATATCAARWLTP